MSDYQLGLDLKAEGQALALEHSYDWASLARAHIIHTPTGTALTSEDVIDRCGLPHASDTNSNNAVGALMSAMARQGWIRRIGYTPSTRARSHGRVIALWERL